MLSGIKRINKRDRKGVSLMIGYVLLITLAIVMGVVAYSWMKTYLPREQSQCPDGSALFIKDASYDNETHQLALTLKNNGRFNVLGYYIYATNDSEKEIATIDISNYLNNNSPGEKMGNSISFSVGIGNSFASNEEVTHVFTIPSEIGTLYSISVTPTRIETEENKERFTVCSSLGVKGNVGESTGECIPNTCSGLGYTQCNPPGWDQQDSCGGTLNCGTCIVGQSCNTAGQCETPAPGCGDAIVQSPEQCDDGSSGTAPNNGDVCTPLYGSSCNYCSSLCENVSVQGSYCGDGTLQSTNGEICDDGNIATGDGCSSTCTIESGYVCSGTPSACTLLCGNGAINNGEQCDDGDNQNSDGCSSTCQTESGWSCNGQPSICGVNVVSCPSYCVSLGAGYSGTNSACTNSVGNCQGGGGSYQSGGDQWCTGGAQADTCCCKL